MSSAGLRGSNESISQLVASLRTHRVNTLTELCRIERIAASSSPSDQLAFQEPMTSAWAHYVASHNLLMELRGMTRNYPFSSSLLDDAKWRVENDPQSNRSWNFAWLILWKIKDDNLITVYSESEAADPVMWGNRTPTPDELRQLSDCLFLEWNSALNMMLRHWDAPPTTTGY